VLKSIEMPPGLYAMAINERKGRDGRSSTKWFTERRLEDIVARLNRFERADEAVRSCRGNLRVQRAYELFQKPLIRASNEFTAKLPPVPPIALPAGAVGPESVAAWLGPAAEQVKARRRIAMTCRAEGGKMPTAISALSTTARARAASGFLPDLRQRVPLHVATCVRGGARRPNR
jgi:hypothetical protein